MKFGIIYKHTFFKAQSSNGIYIGKTLKKNPESRWNNGFGYIKYKSDGSVLHNKMSNAVLKYGIETWNDNNFWKHEIIETNVPIKDLSKREIYWISYYNSFRFGLNSTTGGEGTVDRKYSDDTILKMQQAAESRFKKLYQYDLACNLICIFKSINAAVRFLSKNSKSAIKNCINKPWRHFKNTIFMTKQLSAEELLSQITDHKKEVCKKKSIAAKSSNKKRCKTILQNKLNTGYKMSTFNKKFVCVTNTLTNEQLLFSSKQACCITLKISKNTLNKYLDSNKSFKNYLFTSKIKEILYKDHRLIKENI